MLADVKANINPKLGFRSFKAESKAIKLESLQALEYDSKG
jgi:hypothetical protein